MGHGGFKKILFSFKRASEHRTSEGTIAPPITTKEFAMRKKPLVISGSFNPAMLILSSVLLSISIKLSRVSLETLLYGEYKDKCI